MLFAVQVGLKVLLEDEKVFACYDSLHDTVFHAELGSSLAILRAGYTLDTLMLKYQGADWRDTANWACNGGCASLCLLCYAGCRVVLLWILRTVSSKAPLPCLKSCVSCKYAVFRTQAPA